MIRVGTKSIVNVPKTGTMWMCYAFYRMKLRPEVVTPIHGRCLPLSDTAIIYREENDWLASFFAFQKDKPLIQWQCPILVDLSKNVLSKDWFDFYWGAKDVRVHQEVYEWYGYNKLINISFSNMQEELIEFLRDYIVFPQQEDVLYASQPRNVSRNRPEIPRLTA